MNDDTLVPEALTEPALPGLCRSVMVIEDNPDDALLLSVLLEELPGYPCRLLRASTLAQAVQLAGQVRPEVILLDLNLPDSSGIETLTRIAQHCPDIPVIVLTGDDNERLAMAAVRNGAQDYLVKGRVDSWTLIRTIRHSHERHRLLAELETARRREAHRATHDPLTGLPNRALYFDRLSHAIEQASRRREKLAVLYLDLDGFKPVNDTHGHATGDEVLIQVSQRLSSGVRRSDTLARLGGDEFAVLFEKVPERSVGESLVLALKALFKDPIAVGNHRFPIGFSAGLALYPDDGKNADALLQTADAAMYREKSTRGERRTVVELKVI
ncbi:MAG TPA: GGDEF domain-containing response regulator [Gemmatimonadales bacterium]|nr:GGDEF domain-containing response regulator [Gemmatimonadales bacterium]